MTPRTVDADLVDDLAALVECESPSVDPAATTACAKVLDDIADARLDARAEWVEVAGNAHLRWRFGTPRVLLVGHLDTVWPAGTLARWPFGVDGDRATGPGAFDMKAGLVQLFAALASLDDLEGVAVLVTSDEEIGSVTSRQLVEETAAGCEAALVLEPSQDGAVKVARKGVGLFTVDVVGRAAHAGLDPERGINATLEAAHQALAVADLARPEQGTTVTPTVVSGGTTVNTVPASARLAVDVRAGTADEMERVTAGLQALRPVLPGAALHITPQSVRPPMEESSGSALFAAAQRLAADLGMAPLTGVRVGGGSDGNYTAALGVPTLDGLGAVGANAHAEGEWIEVPRMAERAALVAALIRHLLARKSGA